MDIIWPLLIAIICVAIANLLLIPLRSFKKARKLENEELLNSGTLTEAEILGYQTSIRYSKQIVKYRFSNETGELIICEKAIGKNEPQYPSGSKVPVRYMVQHPSISILIPYAKTQAPTS